MNDSSSIRRPTPTPCSAGGIVREARRPDGWRPPGPQPAGAGDRADLWPTSGEDLCFLTGEFRIFQRLDGHRWSVDDLVTAWRAGALRRSRDPRRILDLGCGIGSVLMMHAWRFEDATLVGVEAQEVSRDLCRRSLAYNGLDARVQLVHGDLRESHPLTSTGDFDLVTGTPPYFATHEGVVSSLPQRGPCRFEFRGGVEVYCEAAARALSADGDFVVCEDARQTGRVHAAASAHGLRILDRLDVVGREGKPPLFSVFHCRRGEDDPAAATASTLVVRDANRHWTPDFLRVREAMGLPAAP